MGKIALYSNQHALYKAKLLAIQAREGTNIMFASLPGMFRSVAISETPIIHATSCYRDLDTNKSVETTFSLSTDTLKGRPRLEESIERDIRRYKEEWPDAEVVSRNAQFENYGRHWQDVLRSHGLDLEDALIEAHKDSGMRKLHQRIKQGTQRAREALKNPDIPTLD